MTVLRTEQRHTSLASRLIDKIRQGIEIYGWTAVMMDGARCHNAQMMNEADRHLQKVTR